MVTGVADPSMTANVIGAPVAPTLKDAPTVKSDRRSNKPIMEKRRRARINNCLNELKTLILDATKKDPARHSKLEKADILEKTVKHLQELQRQQAAMQQAADPKVINKFKAGFADCANEVSRFPGLDPAVKRRLLQHLSNCINGVKSELHQHQRQMASAPSQMLPSPPSSPEQDQHHLQHQHVAAAATAGNPFLLGAQLQHTMNGYFLPNGLQVIPTKLPNGNIALVLPQHQQHHHQQQAQQHTTTHMQHQQLSAAQAAAAAALMTMPTRTASTSSASSHSSSVYERTICSPANSVTHYAPPSPANSYEAMDCKPSVIQHAPTLSQQQQHLQQQQQQQQQQQNQQPLSLVIKKDIKVEDEQPWRPW
ncbi:protein hairy-like isoform X1 [Rhagoletis pomonella]|uniref:protein hairy-like isoform X1 n=2 Tax=Rhagoletis pomonella TaxID=28610 RepID=UPI00178501DA|nr:protein hairy-like isoform X1 [Rhagoletis pomonella]